MNNVIKLNDKIQERKQREIDEVIDGIDRLFQMTQQSYWLPTGSVLRKLKLDVDVDKIRDDFWDLSDERVETVFEQILKKGIETFNGADDLKQGFMELHRDCIQLTLLKHLDKKTAQFVMYRVAKEIADRGELYMELINENYKD